MFRLQQNKRKSAHISATSTTLSPFISVNVFICSLNSLIFIQTLWSSVRIIMQIFSIFFRSQGVTLTRYLWNVSINTLLAESTSDSTVLDNLSINGLLAEIAHSFLSVAVLTFKTKYQTKNKHGQQGVSAIRALILCVSDVEFMLRIG